MLPEDVDLKQEIVMMSPPASDSGSGSPPQFSPCCVDSEPGSPLLDHEQVVCFSVALSVSRIKIKIQMYFISCAGLSDAHLKPNRTVNYVVSIFVY